MLLEAQSADRTRRSIRDFVFENCCYQGFWSHIRSRYLADYIVIEAKNCGPINGGHVAQLADYLRPRGCGLFGMLVSRLAPSASAVDRVMSEWMNSGKMIVMLSDEDVVEVLSGGAAALETALRRKIWSVRGRVN